MILRIIKTLNKSHMYIKSAAIIVLIFFNSLLSLGQDSTKKVKGPLRKMLAVDIEAAGNHAAHGAVIGAVNGLKDSHFQQLLQATVDSLLLQVTKIASAEVTTIRDTLLSPKTIRQLNALRDSVLGTGLSIKLKQLIDTALGENMVLKTRILVRSAIDEALSAKTKEELAGLIDTLGKTTGRQLNLLTDTILTKLNGEVKVLSDDYKTEANDVQGRIKTVTTRFYILLGFVVLILVLLIYVYYMKIRMEKLSGILTYQIHQTKDDAVFNDLKQRISNHAKREGLEPMLRNLLKSKGMLGDATRQSVTGITNKNE
jgi:hypothetical protein